MVRYASQSTKKDMPMSLMQKVEAFLVNCFGPVAAPEPAASETVTARKWSYLLGEKAGLYRDHAGSSQLYREIQESCRFMVQNDELNMGCFQDGYRAVTGQTYTLDIDIESDDIFEIAVMIHDKERVRFSRALSGHSLQAL